MRKRIVRYVNFYPPCDTTGPHPWRTTSWRTRELAERHKRPGRLTDQPVPVEFITERDPANEGHQAYDDLAFDIGMALRRTSFVGRGRNPVERDMEVGNIAEQVMAHLKLCGWEFTRKPAPTAHSTHENRKG